MNAKNDVGHSHAIWDVAAMREVFGKHVQFVYRNLPDGGSSVRFNCLRGELVDSFSEIALLNVNIIIWGLSDEWFAYAQKCENETGRYYRDYVLPKSLESLEEWVVRNELHQELLDVNGLQDYLFRYAGLLDSTPKVDWLLICDTGVCALDYANNRPVVLKWNECSQIRRNGDFLIFSGGRNNLRTRLSANQFLDGVRLKVMQGIIRLSSLCGS